VQNITKFTKPLMSYQQEVIGALFIGAPYICFSMSSFLHDEAHDMLSQETQPSLTNRATHLELLTFEKYRDLQTGVRGN